MKGQSISIFVLALLCFPGDSKELHAKEKSSSNNLFNKQFKNLKNDNPLLLKAKTILYRQNDQEKILHIPGPVYVIQKDFSIEALDAYFHEYTAGQNTLNAQEIILRQDGGDILFARTGQMQNNGLEGSFDHVQVQTSKKERIAAAHGQFVHKKTTTFTHSAYTPCQRCKDSSDRSPVWQLKALKVEMDHENDSVSFWDGWLQFFDVPIMYIPYFKLPTKRCSGFLYPNLSSATASLGYYGMIPYYWVIGEGDKDLLLKLYGTAKGGPIAFAHYRQRFSKGIFEVASSGNIAPMKEANLGHSRRLDALSNQDQEKGFLGKNSTLLGHAKALLFYDMTSHWRTRTELIRSFGRKDYFRSRGFFGYVTSPYLLSYSTVEHLSRRHVFSARGLYYQGLAEEDQNVRMPLVAPILDYQYRSLPIKENHFFSLQMNGVSFYRTRGSQSQHFITQGMWECPFILPQGQMVRLFGLVRGDAYYTQLYGSSGLNACRRAPSGAGLDSYGRDDYLRGPSTSLVLLDQKNAEQKKIFSGTVGRFYPQGGLEVQWPWSMNFSGVVIGPRVQCLFSQGQQSVEKKIPNLDSQSFLFTEDMMFKNNRYPGWDRIDYGSRADYGLQVFWSSDRWGLYESFFGQSYQLNQPSLEFVTSGIRKNGSDIVSRTSISFPDHECYLFYRGRMQRQTMHIAYQELEGCVGPKIFRCSGTFWWLDDNYGMDQFYRTRQLSVSLSSEFTKYWSTSISLRRNLDTRPGEESNLEQFATLRYEDECFSSGLCVGRTFYHTGDLKKGYAISFEIIFKGLGGIRPSIGSMFFPNTDKP
jgi:LPS-assembly protein